MVSVDVKPHVSFLPCQLWFCFTHTHTHTHTHTYAHTRAHTHIYAETRWKFYLVLTLLFCISAFSSISFKLNHNTILFPYKVFVTYPYSCLLVYLIINKMLTTDASGNVIKAKECMAQSAHSQAFTHKSILRLTEYGSNPPPHSTTYPQIHTSSMTCTWDKCCIKTVKI